MRAFRRAPVPFLVALLAATPALAVGPATASPEIVAAPAPQTASPGSPDRILRVAARCPTFSWSAQPAATGYELAVYRLPEEDASRAAGTGLEAPTPERAEASAEPSLAIRTELPAGISSWTPSLDRCLESGLRYAWVVRAWADGAATEWSEARLFEVDAVVVRSELEEVMRRVLARYFGTGAVSVNEASREPSSLPAATGKVSPGPPTDQSAAGRASVPAGETAFLAELPASVTTAGSTAVLGESLVTTGVPAYGVRGVTRSTATAVSDEDPEKLPAGVRGGSSAGDTHGVLGVTTSPELGARGVFGRATQEEGIAIEGLASDSPRPIISAAVPGTLGTGVRGVSEWEGGRGVEGFAFLDGVMGLATGVYGQSSSVSGRGVWGQATGANGVGVFGSAVQGVAAEFKNSSVSNPTIKAQNLPGPGVAAEFKNSSASDPALKVDNQNAAGVDLLIVGPGNGVLRAANGIVEVRSKIVLPSNDIELQSGRYLGDGSQLTGVEVFSLTCNGCVDQTDIAEEAVGSFQLANGGVFSIDLAEDSFELTERDNANNLTTDVLTLAHVLDLPLDGANGIGTGLKFKAEDSTGTPIEIGRVSAVLDPAGGMRESSLGFWTRPAGDLLMESLTIKGGDLDIPQGSLTVQGSITAASITGANVTSGANPGHTHTGASLGMIDLATAVNTFTSAQLAGRLTNETGAGAAVFATSPGLSGVPTAPTAVANASTPQLATTAFVQQEINDAGGTDLSCAGGVCNVDHAFVRNTGDAMTGALDMNDAAADAPKITSTPASGTSWSLYTEDVDDDLQIESASTGSTETVDIVNPGGGVADLNVEGTVIGATITGANVTSGANPGHTHTGASLGAVDVSADTNLSVSPPITLTDDTVGLTQNAGTDVTADLEEDVHCSEHDGTGVSCTGEVLGLDPSEVGSVTWLDNADRTWTFDIAGAGTDPTLAFASASIEADADFSIENQQALRLKEGAAGGDNYLALRAPATVTSDQTCVLEDDASFIPDSCVGDGSDDTGTDSADDLSDNQIGDLSDVSETGAASGEALVSDGAGNWSASAAAACLSNGTNCPADDDVPEGADYGNLIAAAGIVNSPTGTIATASDEADFLASGALTCGAGTRGKAQVHTTPLQYCDNDATPTLRYAAYGTATGAAVAVPADATLIVDAAGKLGVDTTADQLRYYGAAERVLTYESTACIVLEDLAAADDDYEIWMSAMATTVTQVGCHCRGTCSTPAEITLEDRAGNAMTHATTTCSTGASQTSFSSVTAGGSLLSGEGVAIDVANAVSPEADEYTICLAYTIDPA